MSGTKGKAGRKRANPDRMIAVTYTLPPSLIEAIKTAAGHYKASSFVRSALEAAIEKTEKDTPVVEKI